MSDLMNTGAIAIQQSSQTQRKATLMDKLKERPEIWLSPLLFVVFLSAWQWGTGLIGLSESVLPRPSAIFESLMSRLASPLFWENVWVTSQEALTGFVLAGAAALVLGTAISQIPLLDKTVMPYIIAFQTVPKVALAPLFVVWFGFGISSKIMMAAVIAFFPMLINVIEGLKSAEPDRIQMLRVFGASPMQTFRLVRLPSATPFIFAGLELGIVFSILGAVVGEFIGGQQGLGVLLLQANYNFDVSGMFAILIVLSAMGLIAHFVLGFIQRRVAFWAEESRLIAT